MTTERDAARIVRSWLQVDEHESADRVLDTVLDLLDTTPQHRSRWPVRRIAVMNTYAKFAIAAAAVLVVAVVGYYLLPSSGGVGGQVETPSPAPTPTPLASPSPSPEARPWPTGSALPAQRYHVTIEGGLPLSFALPSTRWRSVAEGELITGSGSPHTARGDDYAWMFPGGGANDFAVATDPCNGKSRSVTGASIDDLAAALTTIPGTSAEEPVDVTVGGLPAKLVEFTIDPDPPCDLNTFWLFGDTSIHPNKDTSVIRIWITDVDGQRYTFFADQASADPQNEREIQQIIDSIQFE